MLPSFLEGKEIVSNGMPILESCMSYTTMHKVIGLMLLSEIYLSTRAPTIWTVNVHRIDSGCICRHYRQGICFFES